MKKTLLFIAVLLGLAGTAKAQVEWTIWEGTASSDNNYTPLFSIPQNVITALDEGDIIYATFDKKNDNNDGNWRINWNSIQHIAGFDYVNGIVSVAVTDELKKQVGGTASYTKYEWNNTTSQWDNSEVTQGGDLKIQGSSFTLTKVSIRKKTSMIKASVWVGTHNIVYWNGLSLDAGKFSNIVDNDYIYIKAKRHIETVTYTDGENNTHTDETPTYWSFLFQDWSDETEKFNSIDIPLYEAATGTWVKITSDGDKIASHAIGATGFCCDLTEIDYYHPVTSFSIGSIGLATFCANVAVSVPDGIEAYYATVDDNKIVLTKIGDGVIPANTGVIIKGDEGSVVEFAAATTESTYPTNVLTGVTTATPMTAGDYVLYNNNGTAEFRKVTATNLAANKAYLPAAKLNSTAPALSVVFGDDETTSIATPKTTVTTNDRIYNLSGQEVKVLQRGGIYIKNGKKIIVK